MFREQKPDATARPPERESTRSGWGLAGLVLLPVACCGLPLLLTAIATLGTSAAVGGGIGLALLVVAGGVLAVAVRRRRACRSAPHPTTTPGRR